jgi:parvulin-like peptidyl-prolyl isomerase
MRTGTTLSVVALLLLAAGCSDPDVVAKVGRTKLRLSDLDSSRGGKGRAQEARAALDGLVTRALLAEGARKAGLDDDPSIRARLRAAERELLAQAYLEKAVAKATDEGTLRQRYVAEKEKLARRAIHVQALIFRVKDGSADAVARAQGEAARAYARLAGGVPFEAIAKEVSEDPVSAARGGDLGVLLEGQVGADFFAAAAALKRGETSRPFKSGFGVHVVRALADPELAVPPFEEVQGTLAAEARLEAQKALLERLRQETSVKVFYDRAERSSGQAAEAKDGGAR